MVECYPVVTILYFKLALQWIVARSIELLIEEDRRYVYASMLISSLWFVLVEPEPEGPANSENQESLTYREEYYRYMDEQKPGSINN